jgi:hypothetical protein
MEDWEFVRAEGPWVLFVRRDYFCSMGSMEFRKFVDDGRDKD